MAYERGDDVYLDGGIRDYRQQKNDGRHQGQENKEGTAARVNADIILPHPVSEFS